MRDLIDDVFAREPLDPTQAAQRSLRPRLRRRFYDRAGIEEEGEKFGIVLDGHTVKTPARRALAAPTLDLAEALAVEWEAQGDLIDPATMPLTRLVNTIIDGVVETAPAVAAEVGRYLAFDLVLYRADGPDELVASQAKAWDPVLAWARETLGAHFVLTRGLVFIVQPPQALAAANAAVPTDPWRLGALHAITTLTDSALIALAVAGGALPADQAWAAAHVDEDWTMDVWGRDALALERRAARLREMRAAALVLQTA